jgi:hypothetical protein
MMPFFGRDVLPGRRLRLQMQSPTPIDRITTPSDMPMAAYTPSDGPEGCPSGEAEVDEGSTGTTRFVEDGPVVIGPIVGCRAGLGAGCDIGNMSLRPRSLVGEGPGCEKSANSKGSLKVEVSRPATLLKDHVKFEMPVEIIMPAQPGTKDKSDNAD